MTAVASGSGSSCSAPRPAHQRLRLTSLRSGGRSVSWRGPAGYAVLCLVAAITIPAAVPVAAADREGQVQGLQDTKLEHRQNSSAGQAKLGERPTPPTFEKLDVKDLAKEVSERLAGLDSSEKRAIREHQLYKEKANLVSEGLKNFFLGAQKLRKEMPAEHLRQVENIEKDAALDRFSWHPDHPGHVSIDERGGTMEQGLQKTGPRSRGASFAALAAAEKDKEEGKEEAAAPKALAAWENEKGKWEAALGKAEVLAKVEKEEEDEEEEEDKGTAMWPIQRQVM